MDKIEIIDILLTTYIENPQNRAIQDGIKRYITKDGKRCPIGCILLNEKDGDVFGDVYNLVTNVIETKGFSGYNVSFMPKGIVQSYYDGHQLVFWADLMKFHDNDAFFTKTGVTPSGTMYINFLKKKWGSLKYPKQ